VRAGKRLLSSVRSVMAISCVSSQELFVAALESARELVVESGSINVISHVSLEIPFGLEYFLALRALEVGDINMNALMMAEHEGCSERHRALLARETRLGREMKSENVAGERLIVAERVAAVRTKEERLRLMPDSDVNVKLLFGIVTHPANVTSVFCVSQVKLNMLKQLIAINESLLTLSAAVSCNYVVHCCMLSQCFSIFDVLRAFIAEDDARLELLLVKEQMITNFRLDVGFLIAHRASEGLTLVMDLFNQLVVNEAMQIVSRFRLELLIAVTALPVKQTSSCPHVPLHVNLNRVL